MLSIDLLYIPDLILKLYALSPFYASYFPYDMDFHFKIDSEGWNETLQQKRWFYFLIENFQFIFSNSLAAPAYGVYISQLIRYSRACGSYEDFLDRGLLITRKLLNQGFVFVKLKSSPRKLYGGHHNLVNRYGISVS